MRVLKTSVILVLLLALLLTFTACGGQPQPGDPGEIGEPQDGGGKSAGSFALADIAVVINGKTLTLDSPIEDFFEALGDDYDYLEGPSCAYEGLDKAYIYELTELSTVPPEGVETLAELYTADPAIKTPKGIGVDSSRDDVIAAYGDGYVEVGSVLHYYAGEKDSVKTPQLVFEFEGGEVSGFSMLSGKSAG